MINIDVFGKKKKQLILHDHVMVKWPKICLKTRDVTPTRPTIYLQINFTQHIISHISKFQYIHLKTTKHLIIFIITFNTNLKHAYKFLNIH